MLTNAVDIDFSPTYTQAGRRIGSIAIAAKLQATWWLACMIASNDSPSNTANFTPLTRASLFYAARCKPRGGNCCRHEKFRILVGVWSRQMLLLLEF